MYLKIKNILPALVILIMFFGCQKVCTKELRIGEIVQIPVEFVGFNTSEINSIMVYRIDGTNPGLIDTFMMRDILWSYDARSTNEIITDRSSGKNGRNYGYYESYFHNSSLILDWHSSKDTISDFEIIKSREQVKGCHEDDPNVKIDKLTFMHKGKVVSKGEGIQIIK